MFTVEKDGRTFEVRSESQLAAFLSSGWKVMAKAEKPVESEETAEPVKKAGRPKARK